MLTKKVSKEELLASIADLADTSQSETNHVLIAFYEFVLKYLKESREVNVPNLGIFKTRKTKAGMYFNFEGGDFRDTVKEEKPRKICYRHPNYSIAR